MQGQLYRNLKAALASCSNPRVNVNRWLNSHDCLALALVKSVGGEGGCEVYYRYLSLHCLPIVFQKGALALPAVLHKICMAKYTI